MNGTGLTRNFQVAVDCCTVLSSQASWHCPRDEEKVRNMLLSLGREEIEGMLADADAIAIEDEICGHEYRFGPEIVDELFPPDGRLLH